MLLIEYLDDINLFKSFIATSPHSQKRPKFWRFHSQLQLQNIKWNFSTHQFTLLMTLIVTLMSLPRQSVKNLIYFMIRQNLTLLYMKLEAEPKS